MLETKSVSLKNDHNLNLNYREKLSITGVMEIINFDEKCINIKTVCGELSIDGENIRINVLNVENGKLEITGKINGINYVDIYESDRKSLLSKIFK